MIFSHLYSLRINLYVQCFNTQSLEIGYCLIYNMITLLFFAKMLCEVSQHVAWATIQTLNCNCIINGIMICHKMEEIYVLLLLQIKVYGWYWLIRKKDGFFKFYPIHGVSCLLTPSYAPFGLVGEVSNSKRTFHMSLIWVSLLGFVSI